MRSSLGILASLAVAVSTATAGPRGYLPLSGPPPLRYTAAAKPTPVELPPLPAPTLPVTPSEPTRGTLDEPAAPAPAVTTTLEERTLPEPAPIEEASPASEPIAGSAPSDPRTPPATSTLSAQQLITYFTAEPARAPRAAKPGARTTVIAPVTFVPPSPGQKSVSQATYSKGN